jgi:hypothetical protein
MKTTASNTVTLSYAWLLGYMERLAEPRAAEEQG